MGKAVLISIQPWWCEKIAVRDKSLEVRKTKPNISVPFKCYIYQTQRKWWYEILEKLSSLAWARAVMEGQGKVIGEFVCERIDKIGKRGINNNFDYCYLSLNVFGNDDIEVEITDIQKSCIPKPELNAYGASSNCLFAWHISNLVIYDEPKPLSDFYRICDEWEKEGFTQKCRRCNNYERNDADMCYVCCVEGEFPVSRAPQSWCYVEELGK